MALEAKLPFGFLCREEELNKRRFVRRKWTGLAMPGVFLILCAAWLTILVAQAGH